MYLRVMNHVLIRRYFQIRLISVNLLNLRVFLPIKDLKVNQEILVKGHRRS